MSNKLNQKKCLNCNVFLPADAKFCPDCGAKIEELTIVEETKPQEENLERVKVL